MNSVSIDSQKVKANNVTWFDGIARKMVFTMLKKLEVGHLILEENGQTYSFGEDKDSAQHIAHIHVHNHQAFRDVFLHSSIGAGEAFMKGHWTSPDLVAVIRLMVANLNLINKIDAKRPIWSRIGAKIAHRLNANTKQGSKENISAHYDLGNDFFSLFLDPTMMYSSAIYPQENASLEDASVHKLDTICQKLQLSPEDHLLEIGTGWGGMAIHAAKHYGCKVTTTTISKEQFEFAQARVIAEGLQDKITLLLEDYRDLTGQYDKLVSIEMIEAVGHEYYDSYFSKCSSLLKPHGVMVIQAITIADQRYDYARRSVDFIQKYIFPGGCLPSNKVIADKIASKTDMQIIGLEDITEHYAKTLADWRTRFHNVKHTVSDMGFDDVFCRMWDFYLAYCEGGFKERAISTGQFIFAKPEHRLSIK
ncbi:cyclopropane-fatty-acyl-phospholipid synthase family protein [Marinomonas sp. C2222]|uniref:Cyclopropane-fatty-acyl-phospholipid synthase family protein n=1 Tax=Marinomonas sargassi TaxID=2984494 RepID=A0ABT2YUD6_9GAMM|nr:cyclopropane-fatty-acyl-phospholipid synthase family protein [Marinomonas sargassi]MCV2403509.1 cyclopropane-fatty-acyl-phospholipid synthase family protein [Marinomonas sargassi]